MEYNTVYKNPLKVSARIAYIYPSLYRVMISSLSSDIIYFMTNEHEDIYLERFHNTALTGPEPPSRSIETRTPLKMFKHIFTTLHYEPDVVNLVRLFLASGIDPRRNTREHVVIAGGPAIMENPVPYSELFDAMVIGEAETSLDILLEKILEYGDEKKKLLEELSTLPYVYVPGFNDDSVISKTYPRSLDDTYFPRKQILNDEIEPVYGNGFKYEASRGCLFWCSFCVETRVFQPYRRRGLGGIKSMMNDIKSTYSNRIVIYSLSFPVERADIELLELLVSEKIRGSLPSLRLNTLLLDNLDLFKQFGQKTLTIALESPSLTARKVFSKYVYGNEILIHQFEKIASMRFNVKLYLIYGVKGLATNTVEELGFIRKIAKIFIDRGAKISVSLNPLIPKPRTVFQWVGMEDPVKLKHVLATYKKSLAPLVETRPYNIDWGVVQASIALSDKPLTHPFIQVAENGGSLSAWKKAFREGILSPRRALEGYGLDEELPWSKFRLSELEEKVNMSQYHVYENIRKELSREASL